MKRGILVTLLVASLAGCGRKAPPLPPIIEVPETTTGLWAHQEESVVILTWKYPALTRSGRQLSDLGRVEVWRLEVPPGQEEVAAGPAGEELRRQLMLGRGALAAKLEGESLAQATRGPNLEFRETLAPADAGASPPTFWYAVRTVRRDGTPSALSNIVTWQRQTVPPAVTALKATPQKDGIKLTWEEVPGCRAVIERRDASSPSWTDREPYVAEEGATTLMDPTAKQGKTWRYRVRALSGLTSGPVSSEVEVAYPDIYSPPSPTAFLCLPEPEMVRLRWEPAPEENVSYTVFRRQGSDKWQRLAADLAHTEFADKAPPDGESEYAVKAVDAAGNQSEALYCTVRIVP